MFTHDRSSITVRVIAVLFTGMMVSGLLPARGYAKKVPPPPKPLPLESINPQTALPGAQVTITGKLSDHKHLLVTVAGRTAAITDASPKSVTFVVPAGVLPGPQPVVVMNRAGHAGSLVLTILGSALFDDVTFFLNTSIPMLLSYRLSSNDTLITFFGEKDAAGKTASVTGVATQTSDGRRADVVMDTIGRPSRVILPDGSQLKFSWQSNGIGVLSVLAPNGLLVEGVAINLGSSAIAKANLTVTQMSLDQQASGPVNATAYISVTSNGQPVSDAIVYANVIPRNLGIDHPGYTLQAGEVSPGVYAVGFVNSSSDLLPASAVDAACNDIVGNLFDTCTVLAPVALGMTTQGCGLAAAALVEFTPLIAAGFLAACESVFADIVTACTVPEAAPPGLEAGLCNAVAALVDVYDPDGVYIKAKARKGFRAAERTEVVPGQQSVVNIALELPPPAVVVVNVSSSPEPAQAGQPVTLAAQVSPAINQNIPPDAMPTGRVSFRENGSLLCRARLNSGGLANCSASFSTVGTHNITAEYEGDVNFGTAVVAAQVVVVFLEFSGSFSGSGTFHCSGSFFPAGGTATVVFTGNVKVTLFDATNGIAQLSNASRRFTGCYQEFQEWNFGYGLTQAEVGHWTHASNFPVDSYFWHLQVAADAGTITGTFRDVQHWPDGSHGQETVTVSLPRVVAE